MAQQLPAFILGYHGCDKSKAQRIVSGDAVLRPSANDYDWLGHGLYFWENDPQRALEYAKHIQSHPGKSKNRIIEPFVMGAVINPGFCLDLSCRDGLALLRDGYDEFQAFMNAAEAPMPINETGLHQVTDLLIRKLDCAVLQFIHKRREEDKCQSFDTVRSPFWEGKELYPNAGFKEKNHTQICVRNPKNIVGYFIPRDLNP